MRPIIQVEGLGKQYRIGARRGAGYFTLRDAVAGAARGTLGRLRGRRGGAGEGEMLWALRDVSFDVMPGEVVGFIGRNGAGKSTLLKVLSRITEPTRGRVLLYGRIASLLEVGTGFHPELTGRENIFLNGAILGMRKAEIERKFDEIVAFAEVERFIETPVKRYSSGMYVRLAFSVAAHLDPEILVVDEVLAVGDTAFQQKCLGKMGEVARGGRTVLFVSHSMGAVAQLCTDCVWIDCGRLVARGEPGRVILEYLSSRQPEGGGGLITDEMHEHAPLQMSFTRVALVGEGGAPVSSAHFGDPLVFETAFEVREPFGGGRLGLVVQKPDETAVCAVHHTDGGAGLLELGPGRYTARVTVDVPLAPGRYSVALFSKADGGYWGSGHQSMDFVKHAMTFGVEEVTGAGRHALPTAAMIIPPSRWAVAAAAGGDG